jgi:hypothetical protein
MRSVPGAVATGCNLHMIEDRDQETRSLLLPVLTPLRGQTNIAATAHRDVGTMDRRDGHLSAYGSLSHWERAGVRERSLAKPTSAMKRSAPPAVAMEFDLFGRGGVVIGLRAAGSAEGTSG